MTLEIVENCKQNNSDVVSLSCEKYVRVTGKLQKLAKEIQIRDKERNYHNSMYIHSSIVSNFEKLY